MDLMLSSKRALITGASRGIGFAICSKLSEEGAKPWLIARSKKSCGKLKEKYHFKTWKMMLRRVSVTAPAKRSCSELKVKLKKLGEGWIYLSQTLAAA